MAIYLGVHVNTCQYISTSICLYLISLYKKKSPSILNNCLGSTFAVKHGNFVPVRFSCQKIAMFANLT